MSRSGSISRRTSIPKRFQLARVEHLTPTFGMVTKYAKDVGRNVRAGKGILLSGSYGVGKTYALSALTIYADEQLKSQYFSYEFVTAPQFFDRIDLFGRNDEGIDHYRGCTWLETYETVKWLVINDLGKEMRQGGFAEQVVHKLGRVLRARSEKGLVTHITTNMSLKMSASMHSFFETYGESIRSLLSENTSAYTVTGPDLRERGK